MPVRRDVVEDAPGLPLALGMRLADKWGEPLTDASVEIWHCDALGRYSGFPPPRTEIEYLQDATFLRGSQPTDTEGTVEFRTVYPGWYAGRTIHIHVRAEATGATFTSQLYFPEPVNGDVLARPPYAERSGRDTTNADDSIAAMGGGPALLDVTTTEDGYVATTRLLLPTGGSS
jgi:protocatechuate 3,4-dioxygenase beta subunit